MSRLTKLILALGLLILFAAVLLLANLRLAYSTDSANRTTASGRFTDPVPQNSPIIVWIEEKDRLSTNLRDHLLETGQSLLPGRSVIEHDRNMRP